MTEKLVCFRVKKVLFSYGRKFFKKERKEGRKERKKERKREKEREILILKSRLSSRYYFILGI